MMFKNFLRTNASSVVSNSEQNERKLNADEGGFFSLSPKSPELLVEANNDATGMFGGMNLKNNLTGGDSSFGFLRESVENRDVVAEESENKTAFSFLQESRSENSEVIGADEAALSYAGSSFSFLSTAESNARDDISIAHSEIVYPPILSEDTGIKLGKISATKPVKKKKRASRVGFGRGDESYGDAEDDFAQPEMQRRTSLDPIEEIHEMSISELADGEALQEHFAKQASINQEDGVSTSPDIKAQAPSVPDFPQEDLLTNREVEEQISIIESDINTEAAAVDDLVVLSPPLPSKISMEGRLSELYEATSIMLPVSGISPVTTTLNRDVHLPISSSMEALTILDQLLQESVEQLSLLDKVFREQDNFRRETLQKANSIRELLVEEGRLRASGASRLLELEAEQTRLAHLEEFEKADQLTADMDALREQISGSASRVADLFARQLALEKSFRERASQHSIEVRHATEGLLSKYELLREEHERCARDKQTSIAAEEAALAAEEERLKLEKSQCRREEETVSAELKETEDAIAGQSAELQSRRIETETALETVRDDIRRIEELLLARRAEESRLAKELVSVEGRLGEVRKKYDRQLQRLQDRREALKATQSECLQEEEDLTAQRYAFKHKLEESCIEEHKILRKSQEIKIDAKIVESVLAVLMPTGENGALPNGLSLLQLLTREDGLVGVVPSETASVEAAELFEAERLLQQANNQAAELKQKLLSIQSEGNLLTEIVLPQKEAEKKAHAASKRFKDAAVVAKEIKDLQTRKEELNLLERQTEEAVAAAIKNYSESQMVLSKCQEAFKGAMLQRDEKRYQMLSLRANQLHECLSTVRRLPTNLLELSSVEGDLSSFAGMNSAVTFVENELTVVLVELADLQQRHPARLAPYSFKEVETPTLDSKENEDDDEKQLPSEARKLVSPHSSPLESNAVDQVDVSGECEDSVIFVGDSAEGDVALRSSVEDLALERNYESVIDAECVAMNALERSNMVNAALAIQRQIKSLTAELESAAEREEYEQAALIDEEIVKMNVNLDKILSELGYSTEDWNNRIEEEITSAAT